MLRRSRVARTPDISRIGEALARPGMDTRTWNSLGYAMADSVPSADGHFVEVTLAPSGLVVTARVASPYSGIGFGFYAKIYEDDELEIEVPAGDPMHGCVVTGRTFDVATPLPQEAINNPEDIVFVAKTDKMLRWITHGQGKSYLNSDTKVVLTSPKVNLGAEDPNQHAVNGDLYRTAQAQLDSQLQAQLAVAVGGETAAVTAATAMAAAGGLMATAAGFMLIPIFGSMFAAPFIAAAGALFTAGMPALAAGHTTVLGADTAMGTAIGTFETNAASAPYLSQSVSLTP